MMAPRRGFRLERGGLLCGALLLALFGLSTFTAGNESALSLLEGDLRAFTSDDFAGRHLGEEGGSKAGDYIAQAFEQIGLEKLTPDGFFQKFDATMGSSLGADNSLEWDGATFGTDTEFRTVSYSAT
jgi:hypothetical protein